ncbi:hypothetical protein [uncultured Erythrobacter sp.]|uniref:hypothetical protein n=1 Tax=uncultured Erythrobacter sp. TaxID=263913 RepID=UPI002627B5FB|nr:hypothetical protein [uncultured Erythrobacter sp.]
MAIAAFSLSACAANPGPVMSKSTDKLISYFEAKQELADTLQMQLGGPTASSPRNEYYSYRLVAINGPAYELGSVLAVNNKLDLITRKCTLPNDMVPVEQWASMPRWTSNSTLSTDLGIPAPFQGVFQKAKTSVDADLNFQSASIYQIEDIGQRFLARDEMDTFVRRGDCGEYLSTLSEPVVFVRGIIYGRETLKSAKGFAGGIDLRVVEEESGQLRFKYDSTGAYELSDAAVMPKFAIMAKIMPASISVTGARLNENTIGSIRDPGTGIGLETDVNPPVGQQPDDGDETPVDIANIAPEAAPSRPLVRVTFAPLSDDEVEQIQRAARAN